MPYFFDRIPQNYFGVCHQSCLFQNYYGHYSLFFTKGGGDVTFGSNNLKCYWKSIVLHTKLKIIEFWGCYMPTVFYKTQALFSYLARKPEHGAILWILFFSSKGTKKTIWSRTGATLITRAYSIWGPHVQPGGKGWHTMCFMLRLILVALLAHL